MRFLVDSQAVFWAMLDDPRLSPTAAALFADPAARCLTSPVSHWELAMKISVGK